MVGFLVIFAIIITFSVLLITNSFASFFLALLILSISCICVKLWQKNIQINALKTLLIVYIFYALLAILHYYDIINYDLYTYDDEVNHFIPFVDDVIQTSKTITSIYDKSINYNFESANYGYYIYIGSVCYICKYVFGDYNIMQLFLSSVFIGCLYSVILYRLLTLYVSDVKAYKYTVLFMLCSPIVLFSFPVLRDIHISFLFLIGIYIVIRKVDLKYGIPIMIVLNLLLISIRTEHGIFFSVIFLVYVYLKLSRYKVLFIGLMIVVIVLGFSFIQYSLDVANDTSDAYSDIVLNNANLGGFGMKVLMLPTPLKEIVCTIYSQIFPIPPWHYLLECESSLFSNIIALLRCVKTMLWFYVVFCVTYILFCYKFYKKIEENYIYMLLVALMLIVACSTEFNEVRRFMCCYPIIYILFVRFKNSDITFPLFSKASKMCVFVYSLVLLAYLGFIQ